MSTTRHDRRFVLLAGGAGLAGVTAPAWIQSAFAQQGSGVQAGAGGSETLASALERAAAIGKPLLVIVVPAEELRLERGRLWGDLLAYAPEAAMADFALCEWTCASAADLVRAHGDLEDRMTHETVAVLIETGDAEVKTRPVSFRTRELPVVPDRGFPVKEMQERARELAALLQAAILPTPESWQARHQQCMSSAGNDEQFPLLFEYNMRPRLRAVDRYAGFVRAQAERGFEARERYTRALAQAAALRLWESVPSGASWKTEHVDPCPACGMGMIEGTTRAFLEFFTAKGR